MSKAKRLSGAEEIARERIEQVAKHGYTLDHDKQYVHNQLIDAALAIINEDSNYWPDSWPEAIFDKIMNKPRREQYAIAGAFIAAEIDRIS